MYLEFAVYDCENSKQHPLLIVGEVVELIWKDWHLCEFPEVQDTSGLRLYVR